ncbi:MULTISPECIES: hypothetical protein [Trichocoleus]|uniref:Uncharacterized protein n=1 Tax=Trichocoleus desertorum GB2-A4 TaxID=2933944 RepID=A0ABV0J553_9CYAN|nr:hypothetical protein [Trichocoleus sp. FACHB-46]MBD1861621.1 hypothetical protein [Trichocoleus sp. FACHB-46]
MTPEEKLKQSAEQSRIAREFKEFVKQEIENSKEWFVVTLETYDAYRGCYKVHKKDGSVLYATVRSMPGHIGKGDTLVAYQPKTGHSPKLFLPL